jgi:hypothetical protein
MSHPEPRSLRRSERGQVSWVTLLLLGIVGGGAYLAWSWGPVYIVHFEVKQVVRDYMNQAIKDPNDASLKERLVENLRRVAQREGVDRFGRPARVPVVDLRPDDVTWERDASASPPMLHVAFDYEHEITYPLLERQASKVMSIDLTNDLTIPTWGITR